MRNLKTIVLVLLSNLSAFAEIDHLQLVNQVSLSPKETLQSAEFNQGLVNEANYNFINDYSSNYKVQNTINFSWLQVFRRYNSGEVGQNRAALDNVVRKMKTVKVFDMDQDEPMNWNLIAAEDFKSPFSSAQYVLSLDTENVDSLDSKVLLFLLSNQHVVADFLNNPSYKSLIEKGYNVAVLEYPNYGTSFGLASKETWLNATRGAVSFLNKLTGKKVVIVGHSIGGPLAMEAAADDRVVSKVGAVVTYGGFSDLLEMAKDNVANKFLQMIAKPVVWLTLRNNIIDGIGALEFLAEAKIPVLIAHGEFDRAVPVRHTEIGQQEISRLSEMGYDTRNMKTLVFPGLFHEEMMTRPPSNTDEFEMVWQEIGHFLNGI